MSQTEPLIHRRKRGSMPASAKPPRCWCGHLADGFVYGVPMCKGCMEADR